MHLKNTKTQTFFPFSIKMALWHFYLLFLLSLYGAEGATITLQNKCSTTIWPGILAGAGKPQLMDGGLQLNPRQKVDINAPQGWSGRFWPRSGCSFDQSGTGKCVTGDCGGRLRCAGAGGVPPATLAEFTLDSPGDFYDVSLVDGYNVPVSIVPSSGNSRGCKAIGCVSDLNGRCPDSLQVTWNGQVVACKSACLAFNKPEYCCTGAYNSPNTCKPTNYSKIFKSACPTAYSYAYDDPSSINTCKNVNYLITFC